MNHLLHMTHRTSREHFVLGGRSLRQELRQEARQEASQDRQRNAYWGLGRPGQVAIGLGCNPVELVNRFAVCSSISVYDNNNILFGSKVGDGNPKDLVRECDSSLCKKSSVRRKIRSLPE